MIPPCVTMITVAIGLFTTCASAVSLSGRVVIPGSALAGKSGVTVSLAGTSLVSQTDAQGAWSLIDQTGIAPSNGLGRKSVSTHLVVDNGHLRMAINHRDAMGRGENPPAIEYSRVPTSAARSSAAAPDTVVYSFKGKVFLRDTTSDLGRSGMVRVFDAMPNPAISYGFLEDSRDGQIYRTVKIGTRTWMAQNLNHRTGGWDSGWAYLNRPDSAAKYGRLYTWLSVMGFDDSCLNTSCSTLVKSPHQGICPKGWHVPSHAEWNTFSTVVEADSRVGSGAGGWALKSTTGWKPTITAAGIVINDNGMDLFGFTILPAGKGNWLGEFYNIGVVTFFWSTSESGGMAYTRAFQLRDITLSEVEKTSAFSLRCVQD